MTDKLYWKTYTVIPDDSIEYGHMPPDDLAKVNNILRRRGYTENTLNTMPREFVIRGRTIRFVSSENLSHSLRDEVHIPARDYYELAFTGDVSTEKETVYMVERTYKRLDYES